MPVLKNAKHERFAQGLFGGMTADEAYETAGYEPNRGNASRLKSNESIRKRVAELQGAAAEKAEWTAADRMVMLSEIALDTKAKDPRVAVSAISEANKMQGSYAPTKQELTGKDGGAIEVDDVGGYDLARRIALALSQAKQQRG
jgi:phage terminase small subunit